MDTSQSFSLPEEDEDYLNTTSFSYTTIKENNFRWLIITNFPIPHGYNTQIASLAISIPSSYPTTQIDMAYFHPALKRNDQKSIGATQCTQTIDGKLYQRWSRHRTSCNPWRPGLDDISSHISLVEEWLKREFVKKTGDLA
ncbi:MAG: E2/UBC family protein [Bacillota bacterium]|nr:E2/UBC family protein [Bacillota bacterium]